MLAKLKEIFSNQGFNPGLLGMFINPFYFARKGLHDSMKSCAQHIFGNVIDVGCGSKPYQYLFNVSSYIGLDYDKGRSNNNPQADYFYDGKIFPFENEVYDSCICSEVLEHVFNPDQFLSEIHRVLKRGGVILLTVPFVWDEHDQPYDFARYSSFGLIHMLEKYGFEILIHKKSINNFSMIFQLINAYIYKIFLRNNNRYLNLILTVLLTAPFNIIGSILGWILPKNDDLYLDNIVLAKKIVK